jgi:hypothetical protein
MTHADHHLPAGETGPAAEPARDNLVLDIGGDTGALVIHAPADRDQAEIEISPAGSDARSHNVVRARATSGGTRYAAVFPALPAGDYVVWQDAAAAAGTITVHGGQVASFRLGTSEIAPLPG